ADQDACRWHEEGGEKEVISNWVGHDRCVWQRSCHDLSEAGSRNGWETRGIIARNGLPREIFRPGGEFLAYAGSPFVSLRIHRMQACPKSTPGPYIIGHAPAITVMPCSLQYSTAAGDTLPDPLAIDWCIQTRRTPASAQSWTLCPWFPVRGR